MIFDKLRVRLQEPISGRALVGQSLDEAPPALRVPRMVQLDAKDARFALRAQGLRPTGIRGGAITWQAPWPGMAVRGTRPNKVYLSNPVPEPRPAVLGRLRFRTVAKGDGAASSLDGIVVDVRALSPAPGCPAAGVLTSPYHVVSIPRVDRRVDFVRTQRVADCD
jgi:hypothetical protein